jgi:DNA modification methylase|tara:strand:- start:43 stop:810 length:768 start_codon:yes stop_codon:yes gene_type:complete
MIKNFINKDISENSNENDKTNDISYKYLPVSVFDVKPSGKKGIRGKQHHDKKSSRATYSPFPQDIAEWCAEYHLRDNQIIFDPFAGWGERHNAIKNANKTYIGYDISPKAIDNAKEKFDVDNILANSLTEEIPTHDGLITCPPYWNLEKYEKDGIDREKTWELFLEKYEQIWQRVTEKALPGAKYCIMVGDWRKNHKFYDFTYQTEKILEKCGMKPFDKVVLSYKKISPIKLMLPQAKRLGYTVKVHQTLLVYSF